MSENDTTRVHGIVVEEQVRFTLVELSRACHTDVEQLVALVEEGVLHPIGDGPQHWRFEGATLRRARRSLRLARDLELSVAATALVVDLLEEIDGLRAQLRRGGTPV